MGMSDTERRLLFALATTGVFLGAMTFLPWANVGPRALSGVDLPGAISESDGLIVLGCAAIVLAVPLSVAQSGKARSPLLMVVSIAAAVIFVLGAANILHDWRGGACATNQLDTNYWVCTSRGFSSFFGAHAGAPTMWLWATTGLASFVSLVSGWLFLVRVDAKQESPNNNEVNQAWA